MPELPDFDQIARAAIKRWGIDDDSSPFQRPLIVEDFVAQLQQVWNARGAADLEAIEHARDRAEQSGGYCYVDAAIKNLDR